MDDDTNPLVRCAAIDGLASKGPKDVIPKLIDIINHDNSLWSRRAAYQALTSLTGQTFEKLQLARWNAWWEANKANWPPK